MTLQAIKKRLLDLAIHGSLVPQIESEGTADDILQAIAKEQKTKTSFSEIPESEQPFSIPSSWKWVRLGDVCKIQSSKRVFEKDYVSEGVPFFRSKEIGELKRGESISTELFISKEHYESLKKEYGVPKVGDILLTSVGSIGNYWICDGREFYYKDGNITQICKNDYVVSKYITAFIDSPFFTKQITSSVGGTAYNALTIIKLKSLFLPLPPLSEQTRIVTKLETMLTEIDEIEQGRKNIEALKDKLRNKALQLAIEGKLVEQRAEEGDARALLDEIKTEKAQLIAEKKIKKDKPLAPIDDSEIPFDIPDSWVWVRLGEIASFNGGFAFKSEQYVSKEKGIRILRISDFDVNGIKDKNPVYYPHNSELNNYKLSVNDIIMCMTGGTVGKSFLVKSLNEEMYVNQRVADIKCFSSVNVDYIYAVILSHHIQQSIQYNKNSTNDNISADFIKNLFIPLPPLSEQLRIVSKLDEVMAEIDNL